MKKLLKEKGFKKHYDTYRLNKNEIIIQIKNENYFMIVENKVTDCKCFFLNKSETINYLNNL